MPRYADSRTRADGAHHLKLVLRGRTDIATDVRREDDLKIGLSGRNYVLELEQVRRERATTDEVIRASASGFHGRTQERIDSIVGEVSGDEPAKRWARGRAA